MSNKKWHFRDYCFGSILIILIGYGGFLLYMKDAPKRDKTERLTNTIERLEKELRVAETAVRQKAAELGIEPKFHSYRVITDKDGKEFYPDNSPSLDQLSDIFHPPSPDSQEGKLTDKQRDDYRRLVDDYNRISNDLTLVKLEQ